MLRRHSDPAQSRYGEKLGRIGRILLFSDHGLLVFLSWDPSREHARVRETWQNQVKFVQNGYKAPQFDPHMIPQKALCVKSHAIYINIYRAKKRPF